MLKRLLGVSALLLCLAASLPAQDGQAYAREQERFLTLLGSVQDAPDDPELRLALLKFVAGMKAKPKIPVEAKKQFIRAMAAQLDSTGTDDYDKSARLYADAIRLAPWWGQCYYNRAAVLDLAGRREEAAQDRIFYRAASGQGVQAPEASGGRLTTRSGTADYGGNWGSGLDCWRYEFQIRGKDLTIVMHCWDFPRAVYGTGTVSGHRFEGSSPGGISGTGVGNRSPIRFKGSLSEDNAVIEISSILAPELAETEAAMSAAREQVRLFGAPEWQKQTWRHMAMD